MSQRPEHESHSWLSPTSKALIILIASFTISWKIITTPFNLIVDFPTLLSLLLALFSVALAAQFYFKATEQSNTFYDNTYKFTSEISALLSRIESGFGEKLRHLDESYSRLPERFLLTPSKEDTEKAQQQLSEREEDLAKKLAQREALINELTQKAKLDSEAVQTFKDKLTQQEDQLNEAKSHLEEARQQVARLTTSYESSIDFRTVTSTLFSQLLLRVGIPDIKDSAAFGSKSLKQIDEAWRQIVISLDRGTAERLIDAGIIGLSGHLTKAGLTAFIEYANTGHF